MSGSRPRRATSPRRPFHGHVRGRQAPTPSYLPGPHKLLRGNVPCDRPCGLCSWRTTSRPSKVARNRVRRRTLSSPPPSWHRVRGGPTRRFGGLVRKGAPLTAVNAALSTARSLASLPLSVAALSELTSSAAASSVGDRPPPQPRATSDFPPLPHCLPMTRDHRTPPRRRALRLSARPPPVKSNVPSCELCAALRSVDVSPPFPSLQPPKPRPRAQGHPAR